MNTHEGDELVFYSADLQRPQLFIEEVPHSEGGKQLSENRVWSAVTFTLDENPLKISRLWPTVTIIAKLDAGGETWVFKDARIAALASTINNTKYVMTFESCYRKATK